MFLFSVVNDLLKIGKINECIINYGRNDHSENRGMPPYFLDAYTFRADSDLKLGCPQVASNREKNRETYLIAVAFFSSGCRK